MSGFNWAKMPERGSIWVLQLSFWLLNTLGYYVTRGLMLFPVAYFYLTGPISRRASGEYLAKLRSHFPDALPGSSLFQVFRHHLHFGINIVDRLWLWQGKLDKFELSFNGREQIETAGGPGMLLLGAHLGSFDLLRIISSNRTLRVNVVMHRAHAAAFNALLKKINPGSDVDVFEMDGDINKIFMLKERLEQGEMVALTADRFAVESRSRGCEVSFLGAPALFPENPWILASLLGCPVMFVGGIRTGFRRYHVFAELITDKVVLPRKTRKQALTHYVEDYAGRLETLCRKYPFQWFNFYPFWADEPKKKEEPAP